MNMLPNSCFSIHPIDRELIVILTRGESGYREYKHAPSAGEAQEVIDILNGKLGILPEQVKAMEIGSLFGWDCPGGGENWRYRGPVAEDAPSLLLDVGAMPRKITRKTFLKYASLEKVREIEARLGYKAHHRSGKTMASDDKVKYFRSTYRGEDCVYVSVDGIRYMWTKNR